MLPAVGLLFLAGTANAEDLDCVIEPHEVIDIASRVDGIVDAIEVERGDLITADQVLVRLDSGVEMAAVAAARSRATASAEIEANSVSVDFAKRRRDRLKVLYLEAAISGDQMDEMSTETDLTMLQLERAREARSIAELELAQSQEILKRHTIRSPIDGVVVQRYLAPGESTEDQPIMRVAQIDPLRVEVIVPVSAFGSIETGQAALIFPEAPKEGSFPASVSVVDRVADAASGTFRVRLSMPNPDYSVPSGLNCRVRFMKTTRTPETKIAATESAPPPVIPNNASNAATSVAPAATGTSEATIAAAAAGTTAVVLAASAPVQPQPAQMQTEENTAVIQRVTAEQEVAAQCRTIGPFAEESAVDQAFAVLDDEVVNITKVAKRSSAGEKVFILSERQASRKEATALAEQMKSAGVTDLFVFREGSREGFVSLGIYNSAKSAEQRQSQLQKLGFDTELQPVEPHASNYLLLSERQASVTAALALADDMKSAGVTDLFVFGEGKGAGLISLGIYGTAKLAERRQKELQALGFGVNVQEPAGQRSEYWLEVELPQGIQTVALDSDPVLAGMSVAPVSCEKFVAQND